MPSSDHERAADALSSGDTSSALHFVKRALLSDPLHAETLRLAFYSFSRAGRSDDACMYGRQLLSVRDDPGIRCDLARIELACGRPATAIELLHDLPPAEPRVAAVLAFAHERLGHTVLSIAFRALADSSGGEVNPENASRAYFAQQLADLLSRAQTHPLPAMLVGNLRGGQYAEARHELFQWIQNCSDPELERVATADWLLLEGSVNAAAQVLEDAPVDGPYAGEVQNRLGDLAQLVGDLNQARSYYRKATLLNKLDLNAWLDLSRVEFLLGRTKEALNAATAAQAIAESKDEIQLAEQYLREIASSTGAALRPAVYGLVWHDKGGGILAPEVAVDLEGSGLVITGNVGRVFEDAARVAFSVASRRLETGQRRGVHLHLAHMRYHKEGPSAGAMLAVAMFAALRPVEIVAPIGITGELALDGSIGPVGGLREKLIAAHLHGLSRVYFPRRNAFEARAVPPAVRRSVELIGVDNVSELLESLCQ